MVNYVTKEDFVQRLEQNSVIIYGGVAQSLGIKRLGIEPVNEHWLELRGLKASGEVAHKFYRIRRPKCKLKEDYILKCFQDAKLELYWCQLKL